jgi:nucleotidyltransferase substrate binding protein (TIGR01987 family)
MNSKPRWEYRFDNYKRSFTVLRGAIELTSERPLSELEKIGTVQCFEITWELAWKTLKDYLESLGLFPETASPASTIKAAFEARVIPDGEIWMSALDTRNRMAHTYDIQAFEEAIVKIQCSYLEMFDDFYMFLLEKVVQRPL